jgi:hypothetical protein
VRDHDFPEMTTSLKMAVGLFRFGEPECPIDHRMQAVHRTGPVHRLEIGAAPDADRAERNAAAGQRERFDDALLMFGGGRIRSSSDSPLEQDGFEPSVLPIFKEAQLSSSGGDITIAKM